MRLTLLARAAAWAVSSASYLICERAREKHERREKHEKHKKHGKREKYNKHENHKK